MKNPITHSVSCVGALALLAGCVSASATVPSPNSPVSHLASSSVKAHLFASLPKPPSGSQIDLTKALSRGLVSVVALNEGSGTAYHDAATKLTYHAVKLSGTPAGALPPTWFTPTLGVGYPWPGPVIANNGGAAQAIESNVAPSQFISASTTGYSYAVLIQPQDTTTFGRILDATGAAVVTMYLNIPGEDGTVSTTWRNAAGKPLNPKASFTVGQWILVLCTVQQGLGVMYINGVEVAHDSTVSLANSVANQTGGLVYNATGNGVQMPNANLSSWWVWNNRVLTAQEAAELYQDPWSMLR